MELEPQDSPDDDLGGSSLDIRRFLEALRKYAWAVIALIAIGITGAVIYTKRQPQVFEAAASVQIEPRLPDLLGQGQEIFNGVGLGTIDYYKQQKQVLSSNRLARQTAERDQLYLRLIPENMRQTKVADQIDYAAAVLRSIIQIKYPNDDRIMYVIVRNEDKALAADIANAHIQTYVEYARGLLSSDSKVASDALSNEFDTTEAKLRDAEGALYAFQKDNDLLAVTLEERQSLVSNGITAYTTKLNEAHAHRIELASKLDRMRKASTEDVLKSPILVIGDESSFDTLRAQYYAERNKFTEVEKEVGPKNPAYQTQRAKMDDLYAALQNESQRLLNGLNEQVQAQIATEVALKAEVDKATKEALELGPKIVAYNELSRKKKGLEDRYNILRTRLSSTDLTDRMNTKTEITNVRPLDKALVPTIPVSPNLKVNLVMAGMASLLLGLGLVFLLVFLDRSIKTTADAQQATGAPVLGIIPVLEQSELATNNNAERDLYVFRHPTSAIAECCRSLRTNILFSAADRELKTIVVSSAHPREGKTTSVIYLGTTMAQANQRVLLIDTDMHRPRIHQSLGVPRQFGLSNLIVGDKSYEDVIKTTEIPNLFVLPCGPLPPSPAELLMSHKFESVLAELQKRFDRIILDSPPLQLFTDAVVLSKHADGVILVVKAAQTLRDDIKRSARQVRNVGSLISGVIVNAIEPDHRSAYGYYGSYYGDYAEKSPETQET